MRDPRTVFWRICFLCRKQSITVNTEVTLQKSQSRKTFCLPFIYVCMNLTAHFNRKFLDSCLKSLLFRPPFRLHRGGMHHPLSLRLQTQRMVQLVALQQVLRQRSQSSLQVAQGEALQRRPAVSQTGPHQPGTEPETQTSLRTTKYRCRNYKPRQWKQKSFIVLRKPVWPVLSGEMVRLFKDVGTKSSKIFLLQLSSEDLNHDFLDFSCAKVYLYLFQE